MASFRSLGKKVGRGKLTAAAGVVAGPLGALAAGAALYSGSKHASVPISAVDQPIVDALAREFEVLPLMDKQVAIETSPDHKRSNLGYIRAPGPPANEFAHTAFFQELVKRQWRSVAAPIGPARHQMIGHRGGRAHGVGAGERPLYGKAPKEWGAMARLKRVNAYAFRGDTRSPVDLRQVGGFHPPSTRNDDAYVEVIAANFVRYMQTRLGKTVSKDEAKRYIKGQGERGRDFVEYQIWRAILKSEEMHIQRMVADEFLKGYISTTREPQVARDFMFRKGVPPTAWMYAVHTQGGFLLPDKGISGAFHGSSHEAEIAHPRTLAWDNIVAALPVRMVEVEHRIAYVRKGLRAAEPEAFKAIYASLCSVA